MFAVVTVSVKGFFRDRIFYAILSMSLLFCLIPSVSTLSMRQVSALAMTLSFSLNSFILLLLAVFLGGTTLWRDVEKRYCYSVLGLPLERHWYVLGRFIGVALFLLFVAAVLAVFAGAAISVAAAWYPPSRPLLWSNVLLVFLFESLKYIMLVACAFMLASVSTSFFLPVFGTAAIFMTGCASQQVYNYTHSPAAAGLSALARNSATFLYYLLPNFSAFDFRTQAVYCLPVSMQGMLMTLLYFVVYTAVVMSITVWAYSRRELL